MPADLHTVLAAIRERARNFEGTAYYQRSLAHARDADDLEAALARMSAKQTDEEWFAREALLDAMLDGIRAWYGGVGRDVRAGVRIIRAIEAQGYRVVPIDAGHTDERRTANATAPASAPLVERLHHRSRALLRDDGFADAAHSDGELMREAEAALRQFDDAHGDTIWCDCGDEIVPRPMCVNCRMTKPGADSSKAEPGVPMIAMTPERIAALSEAILSSTYEPQIAILGAMLAEARDFAAGGTR